MGFDISVHPVDVDLIQQRLFPYIRGEGDLDDLVELGVQRAKVRFRANSWGLGLLDIDRTKNGTPKKKPLLPPTFNSQLHVWGRPYFITGPSETVSAAIDRYNNATTRQVDAIVEDMLRQLEPKLIGKAKRDEDGRLPSANVLARGLLAPLDWLRNLYQIWLRGGTITDEDGDEFPADEVLLANVPMLCLKFAAELQPGWMSRGHVWPTILMGRAELSSNLVESPASLVRPLLKDVKGFKKFYSPTITENYMVGGYVQPKNVPAFRQWFLAQTDPMLKACIAEDWDEASARLELQKIHEALADAELRRFGFAEATEIYSGMMGIMN